MSWIKKENIAIRSFDYEVKLTWGDSRVDEKKKIIYQRKNDFDQKGYIFLDFIAEDTGNHLFTQLYGNKWGIPKTSLKKGFTHNDLRDRQYENIFGEGSLFPEEYTLNQNRYDYLYQIVIPEERWFEERHPQFTTGVAWMNFEEATQKLDLNSRTKYKYPRLLSNSSYTINPSKKLV